MKKSFLMLSAVFLSLLLMSNFCEKPDNRPDCEKYDYGYVEVTNNSSVTLIVDVSWETWDGVTVSNEAVIYSGYSFTYPEIPAGDVQVWATPQSDQNQWVYDWITVFQCDTFYFEWVDKKGEGGITGKTQSKFN